MPLSEATETRQGVGKKVHEVRICLENLHSRRCIDTIWYCVSLVILLFILLPSFLMKSPVLFFIGCVVIFPDASLGRLVPAFVYKTPTISPTSSPSPQPSSPPSLQPTPKPSIRPSLLPSSQPSVQPSTAPSLIVVGSARTFEATATTSSFGFWKIVSLTSILVCFIGVVSQFVRSKRSTYSAERVESEWLEPALRMNDVLSIVVILLILAIIILIVRVNN